MAQVIGESIAMKMDRAGSTLGFEFDSAGVAAGEGYQASREAVEIMRSRSIDLSKHQSKLITQELIDWADVILGMTDSHCRALVHMNPRASEKIHTLSPTEPVHDPIGGSLNVYAQAANQIEELITHHLNIISQEIRS